MRKEILLRISNDKIWVNDENFLDIKNTDIPCKDLSFNERQPIFWKVEMKSFNRDTGKLNVNILDYKCQDIRGFNKQKPKYEINYLEFGLFDWSLLEPLLSSYQKIKFRHQLINAEDKVFDFNTSTNSTIHLNIEPQNLVEEFSIYFSDSKFMLGSVGFSKNIKRFNKKIDFIVINDNILPEFDNIKYWFSKKLNKKKFKVKASFTIINGQISEVSALSQDIDSIDHNLIEGIKIQRTLGITKTLRPPEIDKALFTSDDLFSLDNTNDLEGNVFKQSERDILQTILDNHDVRNKRELIYLSGNKQSINYRIRFTNHPNFGYIFLTEGEKSNHFIWELLNSNATYIWSIEKDRYTIEQHYKRIEASINYILAHKREKYKRAYREGIQDNDLIFNVILHKDKNSKFIDEFPRWKHKLNELIT